MAKVDFVASGEGIGGHMGVNSVVVSTTFGAHTVTGVDHGAIIIWNNLVWSRECKLFSRRR